MKQVTYYLMRHARYYDYDNQYISYRGMLELKSSMERFQVEFSQKFPSKKLRIIHSMLPRAKHTVLLMEEMLTGFKMYRTNDPQLNSDKLNITREYIEQAVTRCEKDNEICLFLSHQPDIEHFCRKKLQNSEYMSGMIEIPEKQEGDPPDDLPF